MQFWMKIVCFWQMTHTYYNWSVGLPQEAVGCFREDTGIQKVKAAGNPENDPFRVDLESTALSIELISS
jgi:hypothetical protein